MHARNSSRSVICFIQLLLSNLPLYVFFPLFSFTFLLLSRQAGIGTDATMHDHIKKLLDRNYATKDANSRFKPTALVRRMERRGMVGEGRGEEKRQFEFHQCFIVF